jgi:hypothetical protein
MSTQKERISVTLSGFLGQCFSFLYGKPKQMLTAEGFHGCLITFARRTGPRNLAKTDNIPTHDLASLDSTSVEVYWRIWAETESLRR